LLIKRRIDIVHTLCPISELVAICSSNLGRTVKVVGSRRNIGYSLSRTRAWRSRLLNRYVCQYVANSEAAKKTATTREKIESTRFTVIPNPIASDRLELALREEFPRSRLAAEDELIVAMVATVRAIKDYPTFIRAAQIVSNQYPRVKFVSVGEHAPEFASVRALADELGMSEKIVWCGGVENPLSILKYADIAVLTSLSESFSNAVLEYAAAGVPAVVTDVGDLRQIVLDNETGFVVSPGSPSEVADKILHLIFNADKRQAFGNKAKAHVLKHFSESNILSQYMQFYRRILAA
jgi:glycosyltransferase involved in cell wall biosynthesis